jgi:SagB-type dehydrogenase family enzyme
LNDSVINMISRKGWVILVLIIVVLIGALLSFFLYFSLPQKSENPSRAVLAVVKLPSPDKTGNMSVEEAVQNRRSVRQYSNQSLSLKDISQLLWAAQGITDTQNNFRAAPSAGRVYPLEVYVVAGKEGVNGLEEGVYHYNPQNNQLEKLLTGDKRSDLAKAADRQPWVSQAPVDIVITGVYQRTINKYGNNNQSIRFVQQESGHVGENIFLEATARGLVTVSLGSFDDKAVKTLLNLPADESTLYVFPVGFPQP